VALTLTPRWAGWCAGDIGSLDVLRALDLPAMQRLGLFLVDRRRLEEWLRTPRLVQMEAADVEEVLTEPERQHRYPIDPTCNALRNMCCRIAGHRPPNTFVAGSCGYVCVCVCVCVCMRVCA
jgi:hypothetical protein